MRFRTPWLDLPPELLSDIVTRLNPNGIEIHRLRAVCQSWRSALPLPPSLLSLSILPFRVPPPPGSPTFYQGLFWGSDGDSYVLTAAAVYLIRPLVVGSDFDEVSPPSGWLVFVDELKPGTLYARYPLSKSTIDPLPYNFPEEMNPLDFRVRLITSYNSLCLARYDGNVVTEKKREWNGLYRKSIMFPDGRGVLVLCKNGKMWFLRFSDDATECEVVHDGKGYKVDDIVLFKGRIYAVNRRGRVYVLDYESLVMGVVSGPISRGGGGWQKRLVESRGELHLVVRCCGSDNESLDANFKVYKLLEKEQKWDEVPSLGDQIFLMGLDVSFSVSACDLGESAEGNHILFIKDSFHKYAGHQEELLLFESPQCKDHDLGVFHLDNNNKSSHRSFDVLWPPPPWVKTKPISEIIEALKIALEELRSSLQYEHAEAVKHARYMSQSSVLRINRKLRRQQRRFSSMLADNCFRAKEALSELSKHMKDCENHAQTSGQKLPTMQEGLSSATDPRKAGFELPPARKELAVRANEYLKLVAESRDLIGNFKDHLLKDLVDN